jgi:hypothetical protein
MATGSNPVAGATKNPCHVQGFFVAIADTQSPFEYTSDMKEQGVLFSNEDLGVNQEVEAIVTGVRHSHYGLSWVDLEYKNQHTFVVLNTEELDIDQADIVCARVPEWWDPSVNRLYIHDALQDL